MNNELGTWFLNKTTGYTEGEKYGYNTGYNEGMLAGSDNIS